MVPSIKRIAVLVETSRAYGRGLIEGINSYASDQDDWLLYYHESTLEFDLAEWIQHWQGDGIIARISTMKDANLLAESGIPTIDLLGEIRHPAICSIEPDHDEIARMALNLFLQAGFLHIAFCGYPGIHFSDHRAKCFTTAAEAEQLKVYHYQPPLSSAHTIPQREQWRPQREQDIANWIKKLPKPVAIFACNDVRALDISTACYMVGLKVPEDVSILGVDNEALICNMTKSPLSSIEPDTIRQGWIGAHTLHTLLSGKQPDIKNQSPIIPIPPIQVVERSSTDLICFESPCVSEALRYLRKHNHQNIGSQQIAEAVGVSTSHLNRLFKEATGRTINAERQRLRLIRIRHLLTHSQLTLNEIATENGFTSAASLSKFFKIHEGISPGEFRKNTALIPQHDRNTPK